MPLYTAPMPPIPYFWSFYGHSYYNGSFGVHSPAGRADSIMRSLFGLPQQESTKNHAVVGAKLTWNGLSQGGWTRLARNQVGNFLNPAYPDMSYDGSFFLGWGINDLGGNGNTVQTNTAYQHAMRFAISRCRAARSFDPSLTSGIGSFTYGVNMAAVSFAWETSTGDTYRSATSTTTSSISWTIPADYHGGAIVFCFLSKPGVLGATFTWGGTAGVTGTTSTSNIMPAAAGTAQNTGGRSPVVRRITNLTSANAGQTITVNPTAIDATGSADFAGVWIESPYPPPVLVANTARMNALGYANYTFTYASSLTGTAVASTPATITLASGTTYALPTAGSVTCPSAGGTVTISYTGGPGTTLNTLTGCTVSGGSGNYTSSTLTYVGPSDSDVVTFNTYLTSVVAEFDAMVQIVDLDAAIAKDALALGPTDGLHPSELGAARIADAFRVAVQKLAVSSPYGEASQMNPPNRALVPLIVPKVSTGWYTSPGVAATGTAYTAVAGDLFAIPINVASQAEVWTQWSVETLAGTVAATVLFAVYDDRSTTGLPKHIYNNPCTAPVTMPTGAGVFNSVTSAGNGFFVCGADPGLYWLVLLIVTAGTGVTFRTLKGPSLLMPNLLTTGGGATTVCGWKATGQGTTLPASWPFPFTPGLNTAVDNCPMIGVKAF
jgi:hypothetical protein